MHVHPATFTSSSCGTSQAVRVKVSSLGNVPIVMSQRELSSSQVDSLLTPSKRGRSQKTKKCLLWQDDKNECLAGGCKHVAKYAGQDDTQITEQNSELGLLNVMSGL